MLQAIGAVGRKASRTTAPSEDGPGVVADDMDKSAAIATNTPATALNGDDADELTSSMGDRDLLERAKGEDARHWAAHQRPISAETLRKRLHIGAARSRMLVSMIRADHSGRGVHELVS